MRRVALLLLFAGGAGAGDTEFDLLLAQIDAEVIRRKEGGQRAEATALEAEAAALRARAADGGGSGREAHLIRPVGGSGDIRVHVTATGRPIVLVLASEPGVIRRWFVEKAKGVDLLRVHTIGGDSAVWVPEGCPIERLPYGAPGDDQVGPIEGRLGIAVRTILEPAGVERVVVGPSNPEWLTQHARTEARLVHWRATRGRRAAAREELKGVRFGALRRWTVASKKAPSPRVAFCDWTALGPLADGRVELLEPYPSYADATVAVKDDERGDLYLLRHGVLIRYSLPSGPPEVVRVSDDLPEPKGRCALAIDARRGRLLLATRHERGLLYAFDLATRRWSVLGELDGVDVAGMAYDGRRDAILCVACEGGFMRIHRFSPEDGRHLSEIQVLSPVRSLARPLATVCDKGRLLILHPPAADLNRDAEDSVAFVVEPHSGEVLFASRTRPWEDFEPLDATELEECWNTLASRDEAEAARAMRRLASQGDAAVRYLARRFAAEPARADDFRRWVRELADDDATVRDLAHQLLVEAGPKAGEFLASLDQGDLPPETRRRVAAVMKAVGGTPYLQRNLRAVQILEWVESPDAEALLRELAEKGEARRRAAATGALARIDLPPR